MPPKSQLIYTDNPGSLPATYVIPQSLDLVVQSVVARVSGAAAAATFVPALEVLSQDGRLIARVRPDQLFAVGDTGVVTWSPFLRRAGRVEGVGARVGRTTNVAVPDGFAYLGPLAWQVADFDTDAMFDLAGNPTRLTVNTQGIWTLFALIQYDATFTGDVGVRIRKNAGTGWDFTVRQQQFAPSTQSVLIDSAVVGDFYEVMYVQKSGAAKTLQGPGCFFGAVRGGSV